MELDERRRRYLEQTAPWIGFVAAAGALGVATRAVDAGFGDAGLVGFVAAGAVLLAGYVTARRAWERTVDVWFVAGVVAVVLLSGLVLALLELPPSIFAPP